ncbi:hypothetical protein MNBD_GAMMA22-1063 [hydrothermal vent metagenome]|uniref:Lipoprotein n=1 Tax=hydrothermal vent metagenome TaxID=652676 RepID=A0A3B1B0X6_9ZZZZ
MHIIKRYSLLILSLILLSACTLDGKIQKTHFVNLAPFSENVTAMASKLDYGFEQIRALHTKWYFQDNSSELKRLLNLENLVSQEIHFIVNYSSQIVFLSESNLSITEKTTKLSRFINAMYSRYSNSKTLSISPKKQQEIIARIQKQEKFLPALRAAQPFIDELARYANRLLDQLKKAETNLAVYQNNKIETENSHLKSLILSLKKNEIEFSKAVVLLNNYDNGSKAALVKLKKANSFLGESLLNTKHSLTKKQIALLKKHLLTRLTENTNFFRQIEPSFNRYVLALKELARLVREHDAEIRETRLIFISFASAHRKMSSGLVKPAEWFELKDTPKLLLNLLPF